MGDLRSMALQMQQWEQRLVDQAFNAMQDAAADGHEQMKQHLELATTNWGDARQSGLVAGKNRDGSPKPGPRRSAGRVENEDMVDAITSSTEWVDANTIESRWGWQDGDLKPYFIYQEDGTNRIAPAESLQYSLDRAEDILRGRLNGLG